MKTLVYGLVGLMGLGGTSAMAETLYVAQVEISVASEVVSTFGITDTMYGLTQASCAERAAEWLSDFGDSFTDGTDAAIAAKCVAHDDDGSFIIAKIGL